MVECLWFILRFGGPRWNVGCWLLCCGTAFFVAGPLPCLCWPMLALSSRLHWGYGGLLPERPALFSWCCLAVCHPSWLFCFRQKRWGTNLGMSIDISEHMVLPEADTSSFSPSVCCWLKALVWFALCFTIGLIETALCSLLFIRVTTAILAITLSVTGHAIVQSIMRLQLFKVFLLSRLVLLCSKSVVSSKFAPSYRINVQALRNGPLP